jgi:hypothetical protein
VRKKRFAQREDPADSRFEDVALGRCERVRVDRRAELEVGVLVHASATVSA